MSLRKTNEVLTEATRQLFEAKGMGSADFCDAVKRKAKIGNKYLHCSSYNQFSKTHDEVIITFVNLPKGKPMGGAQKMNNRFQITVEGFGRGLGDPPPSGKVKAKALYNALGFKEAGLKFRGKTATPEKMVDYIAGFINKLAKVESSIR